MDNKKSFFKLYCSSVKNLWKLSRNELRLFLYLCSIMKFGSRCVELVPSFRKHLASSLGVEMKTFYNLMSSLKKKGLIIETEKVYYIVNGDYADKGRE